MTAVVQGLHIYPERVQQNMQITRGLIFSQVVLLALTAAGLERDSAYESVQRNAMKTWAGEGTFGELLAADPEVTAVLSPQQIDACFDPARMLEHVDHVFARVFE